MKQEQVFPKGTRVEVLGRQAGSQYNYKGRMGTVTYVNECKAGFEEVFRSYVVELDKKPRERTVKREEYGARNLKLAQ
ncbi:hypothetical protein [Hymenobacter rubripertinctus]|uniref:50S ribosomal protein L19 n=1 Tax=Hymenobacter rubripertinctus TaxID=2029981 RepID=A0A418QMX1_9BACT|nr:hypothetical protein [Hymenobacter rubripertinctus]RIY06481.1 hypothetical protein D0T11_18750 [Hymenobacter rubripertinctus]